MKGYESTLRAVRANIPMCSLPSFQNNEQNNSYGLPLRGSSGVLGVQLWVPYREEGEAEDRR